MSDADRPASPESPARAPGGNWRDTDEGYWVGVVEGMEAAAGIADGQAARHQTASREREAWASDRISRLIRRAMTEGEIGKHRPASPPAAEETLTCDVLVASGRYHDAFGVHERRKPCGLTLPCSLHGLAVSPTVPPAAPPPPSQTGRCVGVDLRDWCVVHDRPVDECSPPAPSDPEETKP